MKLNSAVSSAPRKSRKAHFTASSVERRVLMSAPLSKALREKYNVRSMPVRKGDTVKIVRGGDSVKGKEAQIDEVYRKKFVIMFKDVTRSSARNQNGVKIGIAPSNVVITDLKMTNDRQSILDRKAAGKKTQ